MLVDSFYARVNEDKLLGPVFNDIAKVDWETHLPKMYDFWESIVFNNAIYRGNPMQAHIDVHRLTQLSKEHFDRWLQLFKATVDDLFSGTNAELIKVRAESIATVLQIKINQSEGV